MSMLQCYLEFFVFLHVLLACQFLLIDILDYFFICIFVIFFLYAENLISLNICCLAFKHYYILYVEKYVILKLILDNFALLSCFLAVFLS